MQNKEPYSESQMNPFVCDLIEITLYYWLHLYSIAFLFILHNIYPLLPIYIYIKYYRNWKMYIVPAEYLNLT